MKNGEINMKYCLLIIYMLLMAIQSVSQEEEIHHDVKCEDNNTNCVISDFPDYKQTGNGCWATVTLAIIRCKWQKEEYQRPEYSVNNINKSINEVSGLSLGEIGPGLFCYCNWNCKQGMKYLLDVIGKIKTTSKMHLPPLSSTLTESYHSSACDEIKKFEEYRDAYLNDEEIMSLIKNKRAFAISWSLSQNAIPF
jgi:hypothetical protein